MAYIKILCCNVDPQPLLMNYGVTNQILCLDADPYHLRLRVVTTASEFGFHAVYYRKPVLRTCDVD